MKKASILIMIASVLSKVVGFLRETILASAYGASNISDAFIFAFSLPTTIFSMIIAAFTAGLIPMFTRIEHEQGEDQANRFLNNSMNVMVIIGLFVSILIFVFTEPTIALLLPKAGPELYEYLVPFLKVTGFSIMFTCVIQMLTGFLQVKGSFLFAALLGFPLNIVVITGILISKSLGITVLPVAILLAYVAQAVLILIYAHSKGYRFKFVIDINDKNLKTMLIIALPLIVSSASGTLGALVNNALVSGDEGGISLINYAAKVGGMIEGIFGLAIVSVMYPSLSRAIALKNYKEAKREYGEAFISELLFVLPATVGVVMLAKPIVQFIYMRGDFTMADVDALAPVMFTYGLGLVFFSLHILVVKVFYSFQDMKTPMWTSVGIIAMQILFGFILIRFMGIPGITLGMSLAYIIGVSIELFLSLVKFRSFPLKYFGKQLLKLIMATGAMAVAIALCILILQPRMGNTLFLLVTIMVAIVVYAIAILMLHIETVDELIDSLRRKLKGA